MDVKNYTPEQVNQIKSYISEKSLLIADSIKWVNGNLKHEDRSKTLLSLKRAQNKLNKIASNIEAKPVIAVFGASQVGKSYLIKNLLSQKGESFKIINNQDSYDFLKDINPAGTGKESTGVVTRFSVDQDIKFVDFPIRIKLLSAKDILTIILDSYFLDLKKISSATINNRRAIESHIKKYELAKDSVKQNYLSEEDVLEVKEYFGNHLSKHTLLFEGLTETRYFERIASIIEYFDYKEWTSIFEILWNNNEDLSVLFSDLLNKLNSIHFTSQGYIKFNDVLRAGGEILDVKRLKELNDNVDSTTLKLEEGSEIQINISYLSALLSELIFSIPKDLTDNKPFLKNSDLLDFPGARSRLGIEEDGIKSNLSDMLLRGKVSYLFNKYSDDYSINNLLFCSNDKQLEVSELSYLLFNWISTNIGSNIDDRSHSLGKSEIYPLFVIFTFFNNQLRYDITNDLQKNRNALNGYLQTYGDKDHIFSSEVEARLKELNANFPTTLEQYNLVLKDLERLDYEQELEQSYRNIVSNFQKKYYDATLQLIKDFPSSTKFDTDLLYFKCKSLYELISSKKSSNTLTFDDIEIARNAFNFYLSKNNNKSSNEYQDASIIAERLRLNYPLNQKEWNKRKEDEKKLADKKLKEDVKQAQKANRYARPLENFIAFGYEGGTIAKYGVRFEVGGGSFVGFFLNVRTSLIKDEEILQTNSEIKNKNEAVVGANFKLLKWAFFNLGGGYGFYKYPQRNDYTNTFTIQKKEYYAAYTGLTLRLGNIVNLVGGASFIDIDKDFYAPEYTFGLTINLK